MEFEEPQRPLELVPAMAQGSARVLPSRYYLPQVRISLESRATETFKQLARPAYSRESRCHWHDYDW